MSLKEEIELLVKTKPKHYAKIIKNSPDLLHEIEQCAGDTLPEKVYVYLYGSTKLCPSEKFKSVTEGYVFCGRAASCKCAKASVSQKVSEAKQLYTAAATAVINQKRAETNLKTHGVENVGQTQSARRAHLEFYQNTENTIRVSEQIRQTKENRYNNPTFNNAVKIKETWRKKAVEYWNAYYPEKNLLLLQNKTSLSALYNSLPITDIAKQCNVNDQTVYKYLAFHNLREPFKSSAERQLINFLNSLGITNIVTNSRKLIPSKKEIDIYLPDFDLAIEYNGVYWHHEDVPHITREYHFNKFSECDALGIQLLTIFSNFWNTKPDIVKQTIKNKLGMSAGAVYARSCEIKEVQSSECRTFLNMHHIQGYVTSSCNVGLYHKGDLIALMTFGKTRVGIGKREAGVELIRFASSVRVVGGASKILAYYIKQYRPTKIISYSDNEWSNGNLYKTLGFTLDSEIKPSYWYLKPTEEKLIHRFNFAKHKLVARGYDAKLTEREITQQLGLLKVWDCGKRRWVLEPNY